MIQKSKYEYPLIHGAMNSGSDAVDSTSCRDDLYSSERNEKCIVLVTRSRQVMRIVFMRFSTVKLWITNGSVFAALCLLSSSIQSMSASETGDLERALGKAVAAGELKTVMELLKKGARIETGSLLMPTLFGPSAEVADLLRTRGLQAVSKLDVAVIAGDLQPIARLIAKGSDVNDGYDKTGYFSTTPIMVAAMHGHSDVIKLLHSRGANLEAGNRYLGTALMIASAKGDIKCVRTLLELGANVNAQCDGYSALMKACVGHHSDIAKVVLANGADVNAQRNNGDTSLVFAVRGGFDDLVEMLKKSGAKGEARQIKLTEALVAAAVSQELNAIDAVIARGAHIDWANPAGYTALMFAAASGRVRNVQRLIELGAKVNVKSNAGETAIDLANRSGHTRIVKMLNKAGAK